MAGFYQAPDPIPTNAPGQVIWGEPLGAPAGVEAWMVLYQSTEFGSGAPIAVSGWIAKSPAAGSHGVLVVAHGTTGLGDECAPTKRGGATPRQFADFLEAGWTVAFTDYQGLGTPGLHHYLVAEAEARSVLDAARAAVDLDPQSNGDVALFGFSQGGHAVLAAAERAAELAPELSVVGTVAVAPAVFLREWVAAAPPAQLGYLGMLAVAYADAYDMPLETWLAPAAALRSGDAAAGCLSDAAQIFGSIGIQALTTDAAADSVPGKILAENEPAQSRLSAPVLLVTGGNDDLLTPEVARRFVERTCELGTTLDTFTFPDAMHTQLQSLARAPALAWLQRTPVAGTAPACP